MDNQQLVKQPLHEKHKPAKTRRQANKTKKPKGTTLPKQFHRLVNLQQMVNEDSDEEEQKQQNRRKSETGIHAAVAWEDPKEKQRGRMLRQKAQAATDHSAIEMHQHITATV